MAKSKRGHGRKWTADEIALLRELYPVRPTAEVAKELERSIPAVRRQAYVLGLKKKTKRHRRWTTEELQLLRELYPTCENIQDVAEKIGRPPSGVNAKAYNIGLSKLRKPYDRL